MLQSRLDSTTGEITIEDNDLVRGRSVFRKGDAIRDDDLGQGRSSDAVGDDDLGRGRSVIGDDEDDWFWGVTRSGTTIWVEDDRFWGATRSGTTI